MAYQNDFSSFHFLDYPLEVRYVLVLGANEDKRFQGDFIENLNTLRFFRILRTFGMK